MKKLIMVMLLAISASTAQAQEIYDYLLDKAEQVVNDPASKEIELKIAQFKSTALRYFRKKIIEQEGSISSTWLDAQALALNEFVTNYLMELSLKSGAKDNERKKIIMRYCLASNKYPLFENVNKKDADAFLHDKEGYTPFTLNTDWIKALAESQKKEN